MTIKEQEALRLVREAATEAAAAGGLPDFLAELERARTAAILAVTAPEKPDEALGLAEAARLFGEPASSFRQRLEFRKALISRPGERRLRYSRAELERIRRDRMEGNRG